jgi:UDP-2,3-diacylglucosamine hydrolase
MPVAYIFSADLHLAPDDSGRAAAFSDFVVKTTADFGALILAGDTFDLWLAPSFLSFPAYRAILDAFAERRKKGAYTIMITGNRDFLLDDGTARQFGIALRRDAAAVSCGGKTALVTHGDLLCSRDWRYQIYRRLVRTSALRGFARSLPRAAAHAVGSLMRAGSRIEKNLKDEAAMDVDAATARRFFRGRGRDVPRAVSRLAPGGGFDAIVCGHVHTGRIFEETRNGRERTLVTLSPWSPEKPGVAWDGERFAELGPLSR